MDGLMKKQVLLLLIVLSISLTLFSAQRYHVFKKGDTLYSIARLYGVDVNHLKDINNISDEHSIKIGTKVLIPGKTGTHTVKRGDTLYSIAGKYKISVDELCVYNNITRNTVIKVGMVLKVPVDNDSSENSGKKTVKKPPEDVWPAEGSREKLGGRLKGVKISVTGKPEVRSVSEGTVVRTGRYRGFGNVIFVDTSGKYYYIYCGNLVNSVNVGDPVKPGTTIATVSGNILVFYVMKNNIPVDPETAPRYK